MADSDSLFGPAVCMFCGNPNYLPAGGDHPCCTFARQAGHARCEGCTNLEHRRAEGRE
jgi:hypothetical protein